MTNKNVRVRFAPSPTGYLHIGGLRAAFFNWLFARHHQGTFLLRIEDTDLERSKQEYTDAILQTMAWVNLEPDEPVLIQSSRKKEHQELIEQLIKEGKAYKCYCSEQDLVDRHPTEVFLKYDRYCRNRADRPGVPYVVRFALPDTRKEITFTDRIRGTVTFEMDQLDDFIIQRSDKSPMYNFVVVVDDAFMKITDVIRGEDHISNTPKQILLYEALGFTIPSFAHLPLILGPSGDRLSKRDAATDVRDYRKKGYLPEALLNYLVRLGWAHGDQEIFTREELINLFSLDAVGKKGAIFDPQKLDWVNAVYIRDTSNNLLLDLIKNDVAPNLTEQLQGWDEETILNTIGLFKDRVSTLENLSDDLVTFLGGPKSYVDADRSALADKQLAVRGIIECLNVIEEWNESQLKNGLKSLAKELGVTLFDIAQPIRIALCGKSSGPGVFSMLAYLPKQEAVHRLQKLYEEVYS